MRFPPPCVVFPFLSTLLLTAWPISLAAETMAVSSPNGLITLSVMMETRGGTSQVAYEVVYKNQPLVSPSTLRFLRDDGVIIGDDLTLNRTTGPVSHRSTWKPVYGERSQIEDHYQQLEVHLDDKRAECSLTLVFRCYDTGVAFHARLGEGGSDEEEIVIREELTQFAFAKDYRAWRTTSAQGLYDECRLSNLGRDVERPLVLQVRGDLYLAIAEAKLVDYARMKLKQLAPGTTTIVSQLSSRVRGPLPLTTPWRVIMIAESPGKLLENNDLILNLNSPCAIEDSSWIKPGKVLRDVTLTTQGGKACIDFAVKYNLQYVEFDAGWYGHEYDDRADATTVSLDPKRSAGPLNLPYLIEYANQREIGIILYVNRRALERQLDELLPLYEQWGVRGVKFGFVNVGSQQWTSWLHEGVRKAAKHRLMVDVHDEYRPTGYSRTYPNLITQEGVRGDEAGPPAQQKLTTLFTRSLAGASDFTICYFNERVDQQWSHAHQLAKATCFYSPWQFVFWYDTPLSESTQHHSVIRETPELAYFAALPATWDDTKVLHGEIGQYAVVARRSGNRWFVGALNGNNPQSLPLALTFLEHNRRYLATIFYDDPSVQTNTQVGIERREVTAESTLDIQLQGNGGQAILLAPLEE